MLVHRNFQPLYVNQALLDLFGYPSPDKLKTLDSLLLLFAPAERKRIGDYNCGQMDGTSAPISLEVECRSSNGSVLWLAMSGHCVEWQGAPAVALSFVDFTERKQAEQALRENEYNYRSLMEQANDGIFIATPQGNYISVNPRASELTGYSREELLRMNLRDILAPEELAKTPVRMDELNSGIPVVSERMLLRKDGTLFPSEISAKRLDDGRLLGIVRDITERTNLEMQLRQAQKMEAVGQLAGGIAHEFNNIIQVIKGYAELAMRTTEPKAQGYSDLQHINQAIHRAGQLTGHLLAFTRQQEPRLRALDLNELVPRLMHIVNPLLGEKIDLGLTLAPGLPPIRADRVMIEQILINLCVNARDAMPEGGRLTIGTEAFSATTGFSDRFPQVHSSTLVRLSVADTGFGMSAEVRERIFAPFFTTKEPGKSTGLGLSTVYGIVEQHGGVIDVTSEPGQGTVFHVYLPVDERALEQQEAESLRPDTDTDTVLIAEDDPEICKLLGNVLQSEGFSVLVAMDGAEALRLLEQYGHKIDVALLDVYMPKLNGPEVYRAVRSSQPGMAFLFCSGHEISLEHLGIAQEGNVQFIRKPFRFQELIGILRSHLPPS